MSAHKLDFCSKGHNMTITRRVHPNGDTYCSECKAYRTKKSRELSPEKHAEYGRRSNLKRRYGLTEDAYNSLYSTQEGKCAICKCELELRSKFTHIDHDHETLEIRGLLCHPCNTAIGLLKEDETIIINVFKYLFGNEDKK